MLRTHPFPIATRKNSTKQNLRAWPGGIKRLLRNAARVTLFSLVRRAWEHILRRSLVSEQPRIQVDLVCR